MTRRRSKHGGWGYLELFEMFSEARSNPRTLARLAEEDVDAPPFLLEHLQEGSGAPEGRVDFPIFLQTVIRHRLRERFRTIAAQWMAYTGTENAQDFREHTVSQLGGIHGIEGVPEHAPYPRLRTTEEEGPSYAVGKYGGIYAVTFELVINDDTNQILNRIPQELGRAMAEFVNQTVVALIESNPTYGPDGLPFFGTDHDNEVTGGAATITGDNLVSIIDKLALRRDSDNIPIAIKPRRLLVRNPSSKYKFDMIIRGQETTLRTNQNAPGTVQFAPSNVNPLTNVIPSDAAIEDPWLNDPNDYYVLADADDRPPFVVAFLRNRRDPYIFLQDSGMRGLGGGMDDPYSMDFDEIPYKIRHVFGVAPGEPQAAIRARP